VSPSPANYGLWGSVVSSPSGVRSRTPAKKVLVHIKRHRTPVDEGKLFKITQEKFTYFPHNVSTLYGYATARLEHLNIG